MTQMAEAGDLSTASSAAALADRNNLMIASCPALIARISCLCMSVLGIRIGTSRIEQQVCWWNRGERSGTTAGTFLALRSCAYCGWLKILRTSGDWYTCSLSALDIGEFAWRRRIGAGVVRGGPTPTVLGIWIA